jgi:photosystem II stability/assembly factor-like uncharacterized protein
MVLRRSFPIVKLSMSVAQCVLLTLVLATPVGAQWQQTGGTLDVRVSALASCGSRIFAGGFNGKVQCTSNEGSTWDTVNIDSCTDEVSWFTDAQSTVFAATIGSGLFRTADGGKHWSQSGTEFISLPVTCLAWLGSSLIAGSFFGLLRSADTGVTWTSLSGPGYCLSLASSSTALYVGTGYSGVLFSTDNGTSWTPARTGLGSGYIYSIVTNKNQIYAAIQNVGLYISGNGGGIWAKADASLSSNLTNAVVVSGSAVLTGTGDGVYVSANNGSTWIQKNGGLGATNITALCADQAYAFAGADNGSLWRSRLVDLTGATGASTMPSSYVSSFHIEPSNGPQAALSLKLSLLHADRVSIRICSSNGREVASYINEKLGPGLQTIRLPAQVARGWYLVSARIGMQMYNRRISLYR